MSSLIVHPTLDARWTHMYVMCHAMQVWPGVHIAACIPREAY